MEPVFLLIYSAVSRRTISGSLFIMEKKIIKQGKAVCPLELTKELLEEEVVCTTSLEYKELNKWSHDQDKSEVEIQQIKLEAKKLLLIKETAIRWLVL